MIVVFNMELYELTLFFWIHKDLMQALKALMKALKSHTNKRMLIVKLSIQRCMSYYIFVHNLYSRNQMQYQIHDSYIPLRVYYWHSFRATWAISL